MGIKRDNVLSTASVTNLSLLKNNWHFWALIISHVLTHLSLPIILWHKIPFLPFLFYRWGKTLSKRSEAICLGSPSYEGKELALSRSSQTPGFTLRTAASPGMIIMIALPSFAASPSSLSPSPSSTFSTLNPEALRTTKHPSDETARAGNLTETDRRKGFREEVTKEAGPWKRIMCSSIEKLNGGLKLRTWKNISY